jgi:uncharacterized protein YgbK (DUF1537 family)
VSRAPDNLIGVIADDFTGALDAGVQFVRAGLATTLLIQPGYHQPAAVQVINANSRETDASTAQQRATEAARQLAGRRLFKKIDSTMRGHVGVEIEAILDVSRLQRAVVCPAVIEAGRMVQDGQLRVNGVLLHESDFAGDPFWPARTSDMLQLVGRPAAHITGATVRAGAAALAAAIAAAPTRIVTVDACTHADLAVISAAIGDDMLVCGALGLARAWAGRLTHAPAAELIAALPGTQRPLLIVAGSRHPTTIAQVDALIAARAVTTLRVMPGMQQQHRQEWIGRMLDALTAGRSVVLRAPAEPLMPGDAQQSLGLLATLTERVCREVALGGLILTGGETAGAVCRQLGAAGVRILGELEVGVPWGRISAGVAEELPLVTKAGGFGRADTLIRAVDLLRAALLPDGQNEASATDAPFVPNDRP